jgi:hypothetical protein
MHLSEALELQALHQLLPALLAQGQQVDVGAGISVAACQ